MSAERGNLLVTGASGQIGQAVCRLLQAQKRSFLAVDAQPDGCVLVCDLRDKPVVARLFDQNSIDGVIHLAAVLPTAFHRDPLAAVEVNLGATFELLRQSTKHHVPRFVFASSMSVFGTTFDPRPRNEDDSVAPADAYGAAKRAVEIVGDNLAESKAIEFVSLRIARVVGPGARNTSSPWRSQIFKQPAPKDPIRIPFAADAFLPLVYVDDVAEELVILAHAPRLAFTAYNTVAETLQVQALKDMLEQSRQMRVELGSGNRDGGPLCDGSRFAKEFGFTTRTLQDRLAEIEG